MADPERVPSVTLLFQTTRNAVSVFGKQFEAEVGPAGRPRGAVSDSLACARRAQPLDHRAEAHSDLFIVQTKERARREFEVPYAIKRQYIGKQSALESNPLVQRSLPPRTHARATDGAAPAGRFASCAFSCNCASCLSLIHI